MPNIYQVDPNEYIQNLSKIKRQIQKRIPPQIKSKHQTYSQQLDKQLSHNFIKYKKDTLLRERIKLLKQQQYVVQKRKKQNLGQLIEEKIKHSQEVRQKKKRQFLQKRKIQNLMKQAVVKNRKHHIRSQNVRKSLEIIQRIEKKSEDNSQIPIKYRFLQEQRKKSEVKRQSISSHSDVIKKTSSELILPKLVYKIQHNNEDLKKIVKNSGERETQQSMQKLVRSLKNSSVQRRSKSQSQIFESQSNINKKNNKKDKNQQQMLQMLIKQKQRDQYYKYVQKNSIGYKGTHHSRHRQLKQVIEQYLKSHIKKGKV